MKYQLIMYGNNNYSYKLLNMTLFHNSTVSYSSKMTSIMKIVPGPVNKI